MEKRHYTHKYLLAPVHPVTVNVIGAGGNGSQVLTQLARIDQSLKRIGHLGLHVTCYDDDLVTEANMGRQMFSPADIGNNKAVVLITRLNRYFGSSWSAKPFRYEGIGKHETANVTISCVDSIDSRWGVNSMLMHARDTKNNHQPYESPYYWIDIGNLQHTGQFVVSTILTTLQPKSEFKTKHSLKTFCQLFPELYWERETDNTTPSCSLAEAFEKQDLFINSTLVQLAMGSFWKMFREGYIDHQGAFLNLQTLQIAKINL